MPRPMPAVVLRLLARQLSPRLFETVAGDIEERWTRDAASSPIRAWLTLSRLTASVLWHTWRERRRDRPPSSTPTGDAMFTGILQDVRFARRLAARQPWLSAAAVATLALGIGATTAMFSVVHAWLLTPLPYRQPERLVMVWETIPSASVFENTPAPASLSAWMERARSFEALAAWTAGSMNLTGHGEPARLAAARVSRELLPLLGVSPLLGRNFTEEEAQPHGPPAVILTHSAWTTRFGARRDVIGERITLSGTPTTVVGVLPPEVMLLHSAADVWQPLRFTAVERSSESRMLWVMGRLAETAGVDGASSEVDAIMRERSEGSLGARVVGLQEQTLGSLTRDVAVLFGATALVLLIACANVASLTLARITGRRQEIVVRTALGAARARIIRQILTETVALGAAGALGGLVLAAWALRAIVVLAPEADRLPDVTIGSPVVFLFAFVAATVTAAASGVLPAWRAAGVQIGSAMRAGSPSVTGGRQPLLRAVVVAEVALAVTLLAGAGLIVRSYQKLSAVDLGFEPAGVVAFEISRPATEEAGASVAFYQEVLRSLEAIPGLRSAALTQALPLRSAAMGAGFVVEGRPADESSVLAYWRIVSPDFFDALSIPLVQGRRFDARDRDGAERTAIVTESFARRAWPDGSGLGRRIGWGNFDVPLTVVGIAGDIRLSPAAGLAPHVYMPFAQVRGWLPHQLVVRSDLDAAATMDAVRRTVWAIDAAQPVSGITTMAALQERTMGRRRFQLALFSVAASLAVSLALVGIYGVLSYAASQMSAELGLRFALGASRRGLVWQVMRLGLSPVLAGVALGGALTWWGAGVLRGFLFGVEPQDPVTLLAVGVLLSASAAGACLVPAWRAALVDPLITMRSR